jgi:hypothetical protein
MAKKRKRRAFQDEIRRAIKTCGKTRYAIWKETGVAQSTLSEFMAGGRGLSMRNLDLLAECLDLRLTMAGKPIK